MTVENYKYHSLVTPLGKEYKKWKVIICSEEHRLPKNKVKEVLKDIGWGVNSIVYDDEKDSDDYGVFVNQDTKEEIHCCVFEKKTYLMYFPNEVSTKIFDNLSLLEETISKTLKL